MPGTGEEMARRWFEEVWNMRRRDAIAEMMHPDAVVHDAGVDTRGPSGFYPFFDRIHATFSDMHVTVNDTIEQGDRVCVRWSCTMRHTGEGLGMAPTGKALEITGITIMRVEGGKMIEGWQNWDMLGLLAQIEGKMKGATYVGASA
jgi:predicted ester cyclase